ncbi:hypothetical protein HMPREF0645_1776 [Hallella bergensis DSM 17361]|uniref:Uncharacterized protein n=1 Tax=Hallella bergensis DSM 17361 TaxID=585502 RepID=D1PXU1_9BACT|nr:hypothetical protein HMPREF0645_1776 [Hallella bergensis DSM 17361]
MDSHNIFSLLRYFDRYRKGYHVSCCIREVYHEMSFPKKVDGKQ